MLSGKNISGNESGIATLTVSNIDKDAPTNPTMIAEPTAWTKENVTITITYSEDSTTKEYSIDGETWQEYTVPVVVSTNNTTVYAKAKDVLGNESGNSTFTVANIDVVSPTVAYGKNGEMNVKTASTTVAVSDAGGSGVNTSTLQYVWDSQNTVEPTSGWTAFANNATLTKNGDGTYYLWIKGSDNVGNTVIDKTNAFELDSTLPESPTMIADPTSLTKGDVLVTITYSTDTVTKQYSTNGTTWQTYTVPVVVSVNNTTVYAKGKDISGNESGMATLTVSNIDKDAPTNPTMIADPTSWTKENVTVTITYSEDSAIKEYSIDGETWQEYIVPVVVTTNNTTVYARAKDILGNESGNSTFTVANIDVVSPTVAYGTNGASNVKTASTTVTVSDVSGSGVNISTLQYVWDSQNTLEPSEGWTTFTNNAAITKTGDGTYYLWIKGADNVGNTVIDKTNEFVIDNTAPTNPVMISDPTEWTNGDVTVTITYTEDSVTKEYSTNGTTWQEYTEPVVVKDNNTTVYARATDVAGNQSGQSTLTITNIDKDSPTVSYGTNGANDVEIGRTTVTVNDLGGSEVNISTLQYVWDTQNTVEPTTGWTTFINEEELLKTGNGTYYLWVKGSDNAGNTVIDKSNEFHIISILILDKGSYYLLKLAYPPESISREYRWKADGVWKPYKEAGILLVKSEYEDQLIQDGVLVKIEDENGDLITFTGDYYLIDLPFNKISESIGMRWGDLALPTNPIMSADPIEWTKDNVNVTITYSSDTAVKEYSLDGTTWQEYTVPVIVTTNNTTVYARRKKYIRRRKWSFNYYSNKYRQYNTDSNSIGWRINNIKHNCKCGSK